MQSDKAQGFSNVVQDSLKEWCIGWALRQFPWLSRLDILVREMDHAPNQIQGSMELQLSHLNLNRVEDAMGLGFQFVAYRI